jgi:hypothetical protein
MVTSNQMRHLVTVGLALLLLVGGICGGLCFAQMPGDGAAHSCCHHGKDHCGHAGPSVDGHAAVAMVQTAPGILTTAPDAGQIFAATAFETTVAPPLSDFSPPFRIAVLRI